ncbi:MAG: PLP-dependent aminotransferase family protein [Solirubrobacterales bacterium]|nr:PLP-dependent aminotransferase family protein [Solirubrobacterales bacterium]
MDQEVARTLGELERKLRELERTLHAMSAPESPEGGAEQPQASDEASDERLGGGERSRSELSDGEPAIEAPPESQPAGGWSRIVDETVEHSAPPAPPTPPAPVQAPARVPPPAGAPWPPRAPLPPRSGPSAARAPASAGGSHKRVHEGSGRPQSGPAPQAPGAAELLHFRERLERAARELTHDYDELLGRLSYPAVPSTTGPTISFARGAPSLDIVDVDGLRDAAVRAFESDPAGTTAYGTAVGYPRLRSWIADRHGVEPERVLVTNGSMQADAFLFEQLVRAGDEVVVERPTYDRTLLSLRGRGARVHPVQLEPDGIDTDALADLLSVEGGAARPTLAHIIPNFQNPAGYTLSLEKRTRLLELAAEHSFIVFEDDPYVELRFSGEPLPTMLSMDPERVVYASSFSKTVCPGIRVGYLVGPADLIASVAKLATNTYISPNMVAQSIVYEFSASGAIERSIETVRDALAERAQALANALRSELADAEFVEPQGGYFMWVTLPEGTDVNALYDAAAARGVSFVKGTDFMLDGGENALRLAYSGVTPEQIDIGIARLADAYRSL